MRLLIGALMLLGACGMGDTTIEVVTVNMESDTYIESNSEIPHGGDDDLKVSSGDVTRHSLVQLPSDDGTGSEESFLSAIVEAIFEGIFSNGCNRDLVLKPKYLTSVELVLTPIAAIDAASAAQLQLLPMARQWWQGATWTRAHPFTSEGVWTSEGGDVMGRATPVAGALKNEGTSYETVEFDVRDLVMQGAVSYSWGSVQALRGFRIESSGSVSTSFYSAQSDLDVPYLRFTYEGPCIPNSEN